MARFDTGRVIDSARTAWNILIKSPKIRDELVRRDQRGCVLRIINSRANTLACEKVGLIRHASIALYDASYAVAVRLQGEEDTWLSFNNRASVLERDCAALKLRTHIVSCAGVWSEFAAVLLLRTAIQTKHLTLTQARGLAYNFPENRVALPEEEWLDS